MSHKNLDAFCVLFGIPALFAAIAAVFLGIATAAIVGTVAFVAAIVVVSISLRAERRMARARERERSARVVAEIFVSRREPGELAQAVASTLGGAVEERENSEYIYWLIRHGSGEVRVFKNVDIEGETIEDDAESTDTIVRSDSHEPVADVFASIPSTSLLRTVCY